MRARTSIILVASMLLGCPAGVPTTPKGSAKPTTAAPPKASAHPLDPASPGGAPSSAPLVLDGPVRVVPPASLTIKVKLTGEVRLISDKGAGLVSNNGSALVSNNGSTMVSNNGSALVANNGSTLISDKGAGLRLLAAPLAEARVADAVVEVVDVAGQRVAGPDGTPITATTDAQGRYQLDTTLPAENLVLRVRLHPAIAPGGVLRAMLAQGSAAGAARTADLDTGAAISASYVLDKLVQGRREVFDKLAAPDVEALDREIRAALTRADQARPAGFAPDALAAAAETLRKADQPADAALKRVEALLVAGQKDLGDGRPATEIALSSPVTAQYNPAGELVIAESYGRRIRVVGKDGRARTLVGAHVTGADAVKLELGIVQDMALAPDGTIFVCEPLANRVKRIGTDKQVTLLMGEGQPAVTRPSSLALAPDGTLYVGETPGFPEASGATGKIWRLVPGRPAEQVPMPEPAWAGAQISGLAVAPDGTLYASTRAKTVVGRLKPGGAWELREDFDGELKRVTVGPDGLVYVASLFGRQVWKSDFKGPPVLVSGTGDEGYEGDGGPALGAKWTSCAGLAFAPDGRLLVADAHAGVVRAIGTDGVVRTIAGASGARVEGDAFEVAVNQPLSATLDGRGRLVFTESAGHTVKRVEGGKLTIVAGGGTDRDHPDVAARQVAFDHPSGVAYDGETLYVTDTVAGVVRRVDADGRQAVVAGSLDLAGAFNAVSVRTGRATQVAFARPTGVVVAPDRTIYFSDSYANLIVHLLADGTFEVLAGQPTSTLTPIEGLAAEGAAAAQSPLKTPCGLAFGPDGDLFVAEAGNYRVARIAMKDPKHAITTYAGSDITAALARLGGGAAGLVKTGDRATEAFLAGPAGVCFDAAGNMYASVLGTANLTLLGDFLPLASAVPVSVPPAIVKVDAKGLVTVVAGPGGRVMADPDAEDALTLPFGLLIDPQGRLIVVDAGQNQVKAIPAEAR